MPMHRDARACLLQRTLSCELRAGWREGWSTETENERVRSGECEWSVSVRGVERSARKGAAVPASIYSTSGSV